MIYICIKLKTLDVTNKFKAEIQKYSFSGNKNNQEGRLITKSDYIKFDNSLVFDGKSTVTTYDIGYKNSKNPYGVKNKKWRTIYNRLRNKV